MLTEVCAATGITFNFKNADVENKFAFEQCVCVHQGLKNRDKYFVHARLVLIANHLPVQAGAFLR